MKKRLFHYAILTILALAILAPNTYAYNTQSDCSNTNWYFITYNTYLFCQSGQTLYADQISNMGTYANFTNAAFNSNQNPSHSFSVRTIGGNTTIDAPINQDNVILQTTSTSTNMSFYYNAYQNVFSEADIGNTPFYPSDYLTSYATWSSTSGPSIYWNQTGNYLEVKGGTSYTFWYSLVDVTLILNHANAGSLLVQPDYFLVTYNKAGASTTFEAEDGSNTFAADVSSPLTIQGVSSNPTSTQRFCLAQCATVNTGLSTGLYSVTLAYNYWTQEGVPLSYSVSSGTPISTDNPTFTYYSGGTKVSGNYLSTSQEKIWIDNASIVTPQNPWFTNLQIFKPSPTTFTVAGSSAENFAYSINGAASGGHGVAPDCTSQGNNVTSLEQNGCYFTAGFYTIANVVTPPGTWAMIVGMVAIPVEMRSRNLLLTFSVTVFVVGLVIYATGTFPPILGMILAFVGAGALVGTLVRMAKRGTE